jgi:beta-galactosidase
MSQYDAALALCYDNNTDWALTIQPGQPKLKYMSELMSWYGVMAASHAGVDIVNATQDLSRYKVVCAPVMYIVTKEQADRIRSFVEAGGTFIAGFRLGVKDEHSRIVATPLPGLLRDVMGVELIDYQPIYSEKQSVQFSGPLAGANAECHIWADILAPQKAEVLASYTDGAYSGKAAITSNAFGKGKAIYLGAHLGAADLARVLLTLIASAGVPRPAQAPPGVEMSRRRTEGRAWTYLLNHTEKPQSITLVGTYTDALNRSEITGPVQLEPYGVRVFLSA